MTAKEKAKELRDKYNRQNIDIIYTEHGDAYVYSGNMTYHSSKQCAIIAVDEIIKATPTVVLSQLYGSAQFENPDIKYWNEVKNELEKL